MKVLIVGGVAGGAAAAARLRRLDETAEIVLFERGEYISYANCGLPYYAGGVIAEREQLLLQTPQGFSRRFRVDVRTRCEVTAIEREFRRVRVREAGGREYAESYDRLILSPGAEPIIPDIPGIDLPGVHRVRTVPDIDAIKEALDNGRARHAVVIGAGFIGLEMAENLRERGMEVVIVEKQAQVLPHLDPEMAILIERELIAHGVRAEVSEEVVGLARGAGGSLRVSLRCGRMIETDMVVFSIGVRPEIRLAETAGLAIGRSGIRVNARMQTNDPDIYAVGDAVEILHPLLAEYAHLPLAWPAARQALAAANTIAGIGDEYRGGIGTAIVKVFTLAAAMTGVTEKVLCRHNRRFRKVYTHPAHRAGYYPGATPLSIKLLFAPDSGQVFGAQVVGNEGVDKRADLFAVAIKHAMTVFDLMEFDLCYAPPFGAAKDPVNMTAMVAVNHLRGLSPLAHWEDVPEGGYVLDVRTVREFASGTVSGAVNIPVDDLRQRVMEIPSGKRLYVFCQFGARAHTAVRFLRQKGFDAVNLSGGYETFLCQGR
ncbi:MAG: FAD-dependent oxidoreductase [Candidatus Omnitrophica bacterium]|nr:FAD-dependent oxidoreductase [Candidatus Omnitrophota bacterium]